MKRIICILLILSLFVITSSCAKKGDEKDKYVEFDKSTQASQQVDTDKTQASDSEPDFEIKEPEQSQANTEDKSHTDNNPINKPDTDVTDGKNIEALTEDTQQTEKQDSEQQKPSYEYVAVENTDTGELAELDGNSPRLSLYAPKMKWYAYHVVYGIGAICSYYVLEHDGIEYFWNNTSEANFPDDTIYESIDVDSLKPTGETVTVEYADNDTEKTVKGQLCEMPKDLANDPYIDVLAVKLPDRGTKLFFSKKQPADGELYRSELERLNRLCGYECLSADNADAVLISYTDYIYGKRMYKDCIETDTEKLKKVYDCISNAKYTDRPKNEYTEGRFLIKMRFKDMSAIYLDCSIEADETVEISVNGDGVYICDKNSKSTLLEILNIK